ncbi:MAG: hypothetical protein R3C11_25120 [Planctomycetaceae bacterium]
MSASLRGQLLKGIIKDEPDIASLRLEDDRQIHASMFIDAT